MPADPVLKIRYSSSELLFTFAEVIAVYFGSERIYQIHEKQSEKPSLNIISQEIEELEIEFNLAFSDTESRIDLFLEAGDELEIFPALRFYPEWSIKCVPIIDGNTKSYIYGESEASITKRIRFLKSSQDGV